MSTTDTISTVACKSCRLHYAATALFCPQCGTAKSRDFDGDPLLGVVVGDRFLIVDRIGHGASGTIYRGEHVTLRRRVAVKVLHHELSRDDLSIERFRREATTVSEIDNEHIVEIIDFGRTGDGRLYLAMELLEGETLADILRREKRLEVERVVDVLIQLGEALMEAHAMGYIHRDLRPRNIYLARRRGRSNFVKLLDFGLAKLVEQEGEAANTSLGMTFGDPKYMSPEQARGDAVDRRGDIYSLGCIAYQMLVGEPPFVGGKVFDILTRHVDTEPMPVSERRPDVPAWLDSAVMCMLAKRPQDRFITVYRLTEALRQGLATGQVMDERRARRAESVPPPSVSRAMEQAAIRAAERGEEPPPAVRGAEPPASSDLHERQAAPAGAAYERDTEPSPGPDPDAPLHLEDQDDLRATSVRRGDGRRSPGGKRRRRASSSAGISSASGISAAWYADGDALEDGGEVSQTQRARLDRARAVISPSSTGIVGGDELFIDASGRRLKLVGSIVGGAVLLLVALLVLWPRGEADTREAAAAQEESQATMAAVAPVVPDAGVALAPPDAAAQPEVPTASKRRQPAGGSTSGGSVSGGSTSGGITSGGTSGGSTSGGSASGGSTDTTESKPAGSQSPKKKESEFYSKLGHDALRDGDILGAARHFKSARELDPANVDAIVGMGEIALSQGAYVDAVAHLSKARRLRPRSSRIHTLLGEAYLNDGQNDQAAESFKAALKIDSDNARARNGYNEAVGATP